MKRCTFIAVGGGEMSESAAVLERITGVIEKRPETRILVMTVATTEEESAEKKYETLFRKIGFRHINFGRIMQRDDAFDDRLIKNLHRADIIHFSGGDQFYVTSLLGGSEAHRTMIERMMDGIMIVGTSAGAVMMSSSMIIDGAGESPPAVGAVHLAPGLNFVHESVIDTHFSQRGRYGRLLNSIAHHPQVLGIGIDERTAAVFQDGRFEVIGEGAVTVVDGSKMSYSNLAYAERKATIALFGARIHILPEGYEFDIAKREPIRK